MQLKAQEEQKSIRTSSQLNIPVQPDEPTENTATNLTFKAQPSVNNLIRGIKVLLILLIFFSAVPLVGISTLFALNMFGFDMRTSGTCGGMQSEDTTQPR